MPTVRGWAVMGAGLALSLLWGLLGHDGELLLSGLFLTLSVLVGVLWVHTAGLHLTAHRALSPSAAHEGDTTKVTVTVRNVGSRRLAQLTLTDEVIGMGSAVFEVSGLRPGERASSVYRVNCRPRGVYRVGPILATATDPLGLAEMSALTAVTDRLVVYPSIEELDGLPGLAGVTASAVASRPHQSHKGGEDFYTLRPYQHGDDLRRVHWPSLARTDELMIRQFEAPHLASALVFLDTRSHVYEGAEHFERAVTGTASAFAHLTASGLKPELRHGEAETASARSFAAAMEELALVRSQREVSLEHSSTNLKAVNVGALLVVATGRPDRDLLSLMSVLGRGHATQVLMVSTAQDQADLEDFHRSGISTIVADRDRAWSRGWRRMVEGSWGVVSAG